MANNNVKYPNEHASNFDKKSKEFGATVGKMISQHWFGGQLNDRREWISKMRSYSRGEQCTDQYKDTIEGKKSKDKNGKLKTKTHKISYTPLKIFAPFKDILINPIDESLFKPRAESIDSTAINRKKDYLSKMDDDFYTNDIAEIVSQGVGVDITKPNTPKTDMALKMKKLEFKPRIELAQELAVENVMKSERFETIKDAIDSDLVDLGIGVGRHYTDNTEGIKLKYVDPYNYLHNSFQMEDGRDIRYHGVAEKTTIADLIKQAGGLTEIELLKIKNYAIGKADNTNEYSEEEDSHRMVEYFTFAYLTSEKNIFKKILTNKSFKLINRTGEENEYNPTRKDKKIEVPYTVWYEGIYVPQADVIIKWNKIANQAEGGVNAPISPFVVFAPKVKKLTEQGSVRFDSLVERAIPMIDDLHRDHYKLQQLKMEIRPNTVTISPKTLNNTYLNGQQLDGQDILDMYFGRGILLADEYNEDGEKIGDAIKEKGGGISNNSLNFLSNEFVNNYNKLRQLIGVNELRDGTTKPNSKTAVSVQKILLASSNNSTNHIVKASFNISLSFARACSSRLYDVFTTSALKKRYIDIIGSDNVEIISELLKYPLSKFAIYFDFKPDNDERVSLERSLIESYSKGEINVAQYNKARLIKNSKSAIKYLEFTIENNEKDRQEKQIINIREQANANAQTSVVVEKEKRKSKADEFEILKNTKLLEEEIDARAFRNKANVSELEKQQDHIRKLELLSIEVNGRLSINNKKEDGKNDRIDKVSSNTSEIVDQKLNKKPPIDFENKVNSIFENLPIT